MDIHQLELFLAVMDSPSMTRAAEKVFLSPGAVSLQLHNLADELHTELFVRSGKRLIPTPAALRLAEHAKNLVQLTSQIKQEEFVRSSQLVSSLTGLPVQPNKAIVGSNAFSNSSGIHQDGFLKDAQTYEIINPDEVGADGSKIVLTARSGRSALAHRLRLLGYDFTRNEIDILYNEFLRLADTKKEVGEDDLHELAKITVNA